MASKKVNLDTAQTLNITCRRGDSFELTLTLKDDAGASLSMLSNNYNFSMQVREDALQDGASGLVLSTIHGKPLDADVSTKQIERMGTDSSTNGSEAGENLTQDVVTVKIKSNVMREIASGRYVYDLQYTKGPDSDIHKTLLKGSFVVNEDVAHFNLVDDLDPPAPEDGNEPNQNGSVASPAPQRRRRVR